MTARILVVDDIPANVKLLEIKLQAEYFEVLTAVDGPSALEVVEREAPDLILTDVMMPGMDGFELCRRLKSNLATSHIPVVMVTALSDADDRVRGLEAGADDFLTKPCNDIALFARVRSLARLKVMLDELRVRQAASGQQVVDESSLGSDEETADARILIADASDLLTAKIRENLSQVGHQVEVATNGAKALEVALGGNFDLIIVSLFIGAEDGLRLCSQLRSQEETRHVPILLTLDEDDLPRLAKGLELGVTDYLIKPIDGNELRARCRTQIRRRRYHDQLRVVLRQSVALAYTDPLTGVYNRRYLNAHLDRKIMEIADSVKPVSLLILDIDNFKYVNDNHGHAVGDEVLVALANRVSDGLRDLDMVARYGGEEFVVVMPDSEAEDALSAAERIRRRIAETPFACAGVADGLSVTVSVGVATTNDPLEPMDSLIGRADAALYVAKNEGRNRVVRARPAAESAAGSVAEQASFRAG